jgi:hypothetical protein
MTKHTAKSDRSRTADVGALQRLAREINETRRGPVEFTKVPEADVPLNDLTGHPHKALLQHFGVPRLGGAGDKLTMTGSWLGR